MSDGHALTFEALGLLARGLAGVDVEVLPLTKLPARAPAASPDAAPRPARAVLAAKRLLLPEGGDARLRRAMVAHAVAHLRHSVPARPARALKPMGIAVVSAIEDARVEHLLCRDFPGVHGWFTEALAPVPDASDLGFAALIARMDRLLMLPAWQDDNHWVNKARRLFDETAATAGLEDYDAFRAIASILANDLGQMRVRFDPQHYAVPAPWRDDNSYLWDFGEAETPPDDAIALQQSGARPPPPADATGDDHGGPPPEGGAELELGRYSYPEWDRKQERLRPDWCTVIEKLPAWQGLSPMREQSAASNERLTPLALPRARHLDRTHRLRRQWEGDDVDLNAAIEVLVDRRLRLRPDPRLFMRPGKAPRATSVLVLLDLSESVNDAGQGGQARSLLDIEKQAALLLAASSNSNARQGADRLAIHGFSSNTRDEVYYYRLLEFGKPLEAPSRAMIGAVRGRYSTRMGAALRHATAHLRAEPAGQRAILLVTDGAPSDIDVHDAQYLIEDARAAVAEAREAGVRTACIAVDGAADAYVRRIFGWRNYCIADDARSLPVRLARMSARLAAAN
ncbi:nitric oxide reductase activation protein NorD [Variovorax sp. EL159]|uniref:nitric oxide reductase activation protein NorD n=1 Tax=Variovorax sp. EL159 TaxID=1566270 RepID=UPI0008910ECB|nr:VWA domain-containing protein [Variovorax sp. EL159]SCX70217.1 von Willebrand factor type A domain-containing protein [Variovorax sp. EL159]